MRRNILVPTLITITALLRGTVPAAAAAGEARPLISQRAENLAAFGRLLAYIRFFHPSDEAASADWNRFAVAGVAAVEDAPDAVSLASALESFFRPLAPTVRVFPHGARPELDPALRPPAGGALRIVAWRHFGGKFEGTSKAFRRERIDNATKPFSTLLQAIAPGDLKGRRVRLRARVRAEVRPEGRFQLGLRVDLPGGRTGFLDNMADRPITTTGWRTVDIEGDVAPDAERIVVLAVLTGEGHVWLDDISLEPLEPARGQTIQRLANPGFDEGEAGTEPPGWYFPYESIGAGYHLDLRRGAPCVQGGCAEISSDAIAAPRFGRPGEPLEIDLGGGVSALVPVALWADAQGTLPRSGAPPRPPWASIDPSPDTRDTRIAALLLAWGSLAHFHPTLDLPAGEWAAALRATLAEAMAASDREAYRRAVLRLLTRLRDPAANDYIQRDDPDPAWLPIEWEWIEDQLVVTEVARDVPNVLKGDLVLEVNGKPAAEALAATETLVSAATPDARRALALSYLATGVPGSSMVLRLQNSRAPQITVNLTLQGRGGAAPDLPPPVIEPSRGIFYVDLRRLDDAGLEQQLPRLATARGIVFDLRGWTRVSTILLSHLTAKTVDALTWEVPVFQQPDRQDILFLHSVNRIAPRTPRLAARVAFLADARTFQNSERLLETIAAYRWGEIVGAPTAGNVGNPNWSDLPGGWTVTWTGRRALTHDGTLLNGTGIRPTVPAARTLRGVAAGRDEVIDRAIEIVSR